MTEADWLEHGIPMFGIHEIPGLADEPYDDVRLRKFWLLLAAIVPLLTNRGTCPRCRGLLSAYGNEFDERLAEVLRNIGRTVPRHGPPFWAGEPHDPDFFCP